MLARAYKLKMLLWQGSKITLSRTNASLSAGKNEYGQLGDGSNADSATPVKVAGSQTFLSLGQTSGESRHTCGVATRQASPGGFRGRPLCRKIQPCSKHAMLHSCPLFAHVHVHHTVSLHCLLQETRGRTLPLPFHLLLPLSLASIGIHPSGAAPHPHPHRLPPFPSEQ